MSKDYYSVLGVEKSATEEEIKKAFRRKAHQHHPDKGGDEKVFKDVNQAYYILGNKERRQTYDQFGSAAFEQGGAGGGSPFGGFGAGGFPGGFQVNMDDLGDFGDVLGSMFGFGGGGGGTRVRKGRDLTVEISLTFKEAVFGVRKEIPVYTNNPCTRCSGSGADSESSVKTCDTCKGSGRVQRVQRTFIGSINTVSACSDCGGDGKRIEKPCSACKGSGIEKREKTLLVDIPAGVDHGDAVKVAGEGDYPGAGGRSGDLYVRIRVQKDSELQRDGTDIRSEIRIPFSVLALGGTSEVETVDGPVVLKIPAGSAAGTVLKLRGKGVPGKYGRGDHFVRVLPFVPEKLTRDQKKALSGLKDCGL